MGAKLPRLGCSLTGRKDGGRVRVQEVPFLELCTKIDHSIPTVGLVSHEGGVCHQGDPH